jgi:hypothetical protein
MKAILNSAIAFSLLIASGNAQSTETPHPHNAAPSAVHETPPAQPETGDLEQMRADLERLKVLLNQMRTNLAFVQTTQTPLKHQFELETDAWQVIVEQMERRVKQMEDHRVPGSGR